MAKGGSVYMMSNPQRTVIYIGVTSELISRVIQHKKGHYHGFSARYHCTDLLYHEELSSIEEAIAREKQLKNWHKEWKWNLVKESNPQSVDLSESIGISLEHDL